MVGRMSAVSMNESLKQRVYMLLGIAYLASMPTSVSYAQAFADPMRPANAAPISAGPARSAAAPSGPRLTAVFLNGERRIAVIDGRVVREGDRVSGDTVIEILADNVRLARAGHTQTLRFPKSTVPVRTRTTVESEP
jgi:MSHA biogenesis protein MshK